MQIGTIAVALPPWEHMHLCSLHACTPDALLKNCHSNEGDVFCAPRNRGFVLIACSQGVCCTPHR